MSVKWGKIMRSPSLYNIKNTEIDKEYLETSTYKLTRGPLPSSQYKQIGSCIFVILILKCLTFECLSFTKITIVDNSEQAIKYDLIR